MPKYPESRVEGVVSGSSAASISLTDSGGYFSSSDVEGALQEIGPGVLTDGEYTNQVLEWDGSGWSPYGYKDTFPGSGNETALNARWTPPTPDTGAGEAITVGSNALTVQTATAGSGIRIEGEDIASQPFDLRMHVTTSGFASNTDRVDLEVGGNHASGIALRLMRFSGVNNLYSGKLGSDFDTQGSVPSAVWLRIVGLADGTVHTYYSTAAHTAEPSGLVGWTLLGSSTLAGISDSSVRILTYGVAQVTAVIRNFKLSRPH